MRITERISCSCNLFEQNVVASISRTDSMALSPRNCETQSLADGCIRHRRWNRLTLYARSAV